MAAPTCSDPEMAETQDRAENGTNNKETVKRKRKRSSKQLWNRMVKRRRTGDLDDDTYQYYARVLERLRENFDNEEDKEIFVNNVFEQMKDKEMVIACNKLGSRVMEHMLPIAPFEKLQSFMAAVKNDFRTACTDQVGSHVTEVVLMQTLEWINKYSTKTEVGESNDTEDSNLTFLREWLNDFTLFVTNNLPEFIFDPYASHVVRQLLIVVAGRTNRTHWQARPREVELTPKTTKYLGKHLKSIYNQVMKLDINPVLVTDPSASALLQGLLLALESKPKLCTPLIEKILDKALVKESGGDILLPVVLVDQNGSHLMEKIVTTSSDLVFDSLLKIHLKEKLSEMAEHRIANFIVQRLISSCRTSEQFRILMKKLLPNVDLLMRHTGILMNLVQTCLNYPSEQANFLKTLMAGLHCSQPPLGSPLHLVPLLLQMKFEIRSSARERLSSPIVLHGSLIVQSLLKFDKPETVVTSLFSLPSEDILTISCDRCGSHVVDAFFQSPSVKDKSKAKLFNLLKGNLFTLACDKYGSRSLDSLWKVATLPQRVSMADELIVHEAQLGNHHIGRCALRNFTLEQFKQHPDDWKLAQGREDKTRKMFSNILEGTFPSWTGITTSEGGGAQTAPKQGKKKGQKQAKKQGTKQRPVNWYSKDQQ